MFLYKSQELLRNIIYELNHLVDELRKKSDEIPLTISTENREMTVSIYISNVQEGLEGTNEYFEMPPIPPDGIFDVRIPLNNTNGLSSVVIDRNEDFETEIDVMLPVESDRFIMSWDGDERGLEPGRYKITDGNNVLDMAFTNQIIVNAGNRLKFYYIGKEEITSKYRLMNNYPNPFNNQTTITYTILSAGKVELEIYNILGQEVAKLVDKYHQPGSYTVLWNGTNKYGKEVSGGLYLYQLRVHDFVKTKRMVFIK